MYGFAISVIYIYMAINLCYQTNQLNRNGFVFHGSYIKSRHGKLSDEGLYRQFQCFHFWTSFDGNVKIFE